METYYKFDNLITNLKIFDKVQSFKMSLLIFRA